MSLMYRCGWHCKKCGRRQMFESFSDPAEWRTDESDWVRRQRDLSLVEHEKANYECRGKIEVLGVVVLAGPEQREVARFNP